MDLIHHWFELEVKPVELYLMHGKLARICQDTSPIPSTLSQNFLCYFTTRILGKQNEKPTCKAETKRSIPLLLYRSGQYLGG